MYDKFKLTMTRELNLLSQELDYYTRRLNSSLFSVEKVFYSKVIIDIQNKIEGIVGEQFYAFVDSAQCEIDGKQCMVV